MIRLAIFARVAATAFLCAAAAALLVLVCVLAAPKFVGGQSYAVLSNSMKGAVDTGDQVVVIPVPAADLKVGQIAAFDDPGGSGRLYQHRVQRVEVLDGTTKVITKGDANTAAETWQVSAGGEVGRVVAVVPKLGYATAEIASPLGRILLLVVPAILLAIAILHGIWRRPETAVVDGV